MHTKNLVIPTYQQTFPHYPQIQIILLTVLCEKHATIYRITTSYAQVINISTNGEREKEYLEQTLPVIQRI